VVLKNFTVPLMAMGRLSDNVARADLGGAEPGFPTGDMPGGRTFTRSGGRRIGRKMPAASDRARFSETYPPYMLEKRDNFKAFRRAADRPRQRRARNSLLRSECGRET